MPDPAWPNFHKTLLPEKERLSITLFIHSSCKICEFPKTCVRHRSCAASVKLISCSDNSIARLLLHVPLAIP